MECTKCNTVVEEDQIEECENCGASCCGDCISAEAGHCETCERELEGMDEEDACDACGGPVEDNYNGDNLCSDCHPGHCEECGDILDSDDELCRDCREERDEDKRWDED